MHRQNRRGTSQKRIAYDFWFGDVLYPYTYVRMTYVYVYMYLNVPLATHLDTR